ncbi:MAG: hypothetical protein AAGG81_04295 [Chlamydiota bacterium]
MSTGSTRAPEDMSFSEAFASLYNNAQPLGMGFLNPHHDKQIRTHDEAMRVFFNDCSSDGYCGYVRGRPMKVDFSEYPKISTRSYDRYYGEGAAEKSLSEERTKFQDKTRETYKECNRCDIFDKATKKLLCQSELSEFQSQFEACQILSENREAAKQRFQQNPFVEKFFKNCTANYTIKDFNSINTVGHRGNKCEEALEHLGWLSNKESYIDDFKVCLSPHYFPGVRSCRSASGSMELNDVIETLSRQCNKE